MTSYAAREKELEDLHQAILAEKSKVLAELKSYSEQERKGLNASEEAHKRNQTLLQDLRALEKNVKRRSQVSPDHSLVKLENRYWASVEAELPNWELFLLGKAHQPFGVKEKKLNLRHSHTMEAPKKKSLPPSGFSPNTFPR
ncbi:centrosomal protein 15 [Hyperolius riggenbachi]|uniref:centrosomal protein 15 n=1 Tax=Hyperolius riggenbachi TaxID=752182 RepID=UPI0035A3B5F4